MKNNLVYKEYTMICDHEFDLVDTDYDQINTVDGIKDGYIEYYECIHCKQKMRRLYVFIKEEDYEG